MSHYIRLSAQDASFLSSDDEATPMVIASLAIYDAKPLMLPDGGLDAARLQRYVSSALTLAPALRRRLEYTPIFRHPVWVDADDVDLGHHMIRIAVPSPFDTRSLMELVGRIYNQPLTRDRPLWDIWVIEGLQDQRFALLTRIHHALVDGASGTVLLQALHTLDPAEKESREQAAFEPRRAPGREQLLLDEVGHRLRGVGDLASGALRGLLRPRDTLGKTLELAGGLFAAAQHVAEPSPINAPVGRRRRIHWLNTPLDELKDIKRELGGTLNDVVLAVTAGALRRLFRSQGHDADRIKLRVACPSNMRRAGEQTSSGNQTATLLIDLPVDIEDALERYEAVMERTALAKASHQSDAVQFVIDLADRAAPELVHAVMSLSSRFQNMVVSNVPGPPVPIYAMGCQAQELYPLTILMKGTALAITVFSYDGRMHWSFCADWDVIPSLDPLARGIRHEIALLAEPPLYHRVRVG